MKQIDKKYFLTLVLSICFSNLLEAQIDVFTDNFAANNNSTWRAGNPVAIPSTNWTFCSLDDRYGARINTNYLEITNRRTGASRHAQGFAYVTSGGVGSVFNAAYNPVLSGNAGAVTWTFNMRKATGTENGGFSCTSSGSQNYRTTGLAFILATSSTSGMLGSTSNCNANATATGYAVIFGTNENSDNPLRPKLVRFTNGLHNGAIHVIAEWPTNITRSHYMSIRVTYSTCSNTWTLQCRSDGASSAANPNAGTYAAAVAGVDATYVNVALNYMGAYFQAGCASLCNEQYIARFDNVNVHVGSGCPLPITLSNFSASCEGKNARITWATASEQNSDYFTLERSRDGYSWEEIATVDGAGTTNLSNTYAVSDNISADLYYRLKQTDFDGQSNYFGPIHVDCNSPNNELAVYPNPNNGIFTVAINSMEALGEVTVFIHDLSGKLITFSDLNVLTGTNTVHFEDTNLVRGTYLISVQGKDKSHLYPVKLIVW